MPSTATLNNAAAANGTRKTRAAGVEPTRERMICTPHQARAWLDKNQGNRKPRKNHVEKLARDMKNGHWDYTGDPIRFDTDARLIDGQHRLLACIRADTPFETEVIYNLPPEVQAKIDAGRPRSAGDILGMDGMHNANNLASACRILLGIRDDVSLVNNMYSTSDILDCLEKHKELPSSLRKASSKKAPNGIPVPVLAVIHYIGSHLLNVPRVADAYLAVMHDGIPAYEGDPAHACREKIIRGFSGITTISRKDRIRLLIHAWNLFSAGQKAKNIRGGADVSFVGLKKAML